MNDMSRKKKYRRYEICQVEPVTTPDGKTEYKPIPGTDEVLDAKASENKRRREKRKIWAKENADKVQTSRAKWNAKNPDKRKAVNVAAEKNRTDRNYHKPYVAIDAEGMNIKGHDIEVSRHKFRRKKTKSGDDPKDIYVEHRTILWGAQGWERTHSSTRLDEIASHCLNGGKGGRPLTAPQIMRWLSEQGIATPPPRLDKDDEPWTPGAIMSWLRTQGAETEAHWLGTDKTPLHTDDILEWLTSLPAKFGPEIKDENGRSKYPKGVNFIAYAFNYDVTQLFKDMDYRTVWEIVRKRSFRRKTKLRLTTPIYYKGYAISYLKSKFLDVWKLRDPGNPRRIKLDKNGDPIPMLDANGNPIYHLAHGEWRLKLQTELDAVAHIRIEDAYGFYQESFVKATESLIKPGYQSRKEWDAIERNKRERDLFGEDDKPFAGIQEYCHSELVALSQLLTVLRDGFDNMDITLRGWSGPGKAAGALVGKHELKKNHYSLDIATTNITPQQKQAHHAFYGGRIELVKQGYDANRMLWVYDIVSAYPSACLELPSMRDGTWRQHSHETVTDPLATASTANILSMFRVKWHMPREDKRKRIVPFFPFPYRTRKRGAILFPNAGHAWIMRDEIISACEWCARFFPGRPLADLFTIKEWNEFIPGNDERPYAFIVRLFEMRLAAKDAERATGIYDIVEKTIKLTLNSLYGKTCQSVGGDDGKAPACVCPYYAAAITANCRSRLLRAALIDPHAIVSFMTDGLVSTRELVGLPRVKVKDKERVALGDWEMETKTGGFFFQSGLYSLENGALKPKSKLRGVNPQRFVLKKSVHDFYTQDMLGAWRKPSTDADTFALPYTIRIYVTAGAAVASRETFKRIGRWASVQRKYDIHHPGVKRCFDGVSEAAYLSARPAGAELDFKVVEKLAKQWDADPRKIAECLIAGEALRCRFLIPTTPATNLTPDRLSAPAEPEWLDEDADVDLIEDGDVSKLQSEEYLDTSEIMQGMG
jgi:hypothetical protein